MKTKNEQIAKVKNIVAKFRNIDARLLEVANCNDLPDVELGFAAMGSGGVGQTKQMRDGSVRVQLSYGRGRYNYAHVAIIR